MNESQKLIGLLGIVTVLAGAAFAETEALPPEIAHRIAVRKAINDPATGLKAAEAALDDGDPLIRRFALVVCAKAYANDKPRYEALAKRFAKDTNTSVRIVAKSMNRQQVLYRENQAYSLSPQIDFETKYLQKPAVKKDGTFELQKPVPKYEAVELWFGKPKHDLYVWMNDIYLGQFDSDLDKGKEFRLDATQETKADGVNKVVIKNLDGKVIKAKFTVQVLAWRGEL